MTAGLDANGLTTKTLQEVLTAYEDSEKANIDAALDVSPAQPIGQVNGAIAETQRANWELTEGVYNALDPDKAEGVQLDILCSYTGTIRRAATATTAIVKLALNPGTTVAAGKRVAVEDHPEIEFTTDASTTNSGGTVAEIPVNVTCTTLGAIPVDALLINQIVTPVTGWGGVVNDDPAITGTDVETDTALRLRRIAELTSAGNGSPDGIRADLLKLDNVIDARVFENTTDYTVGILPPHSLRAVVWDATLEDNANIAAVLWRNRSAGISAIGSLSGNVTDSLGVVRTMAFDRATQLTLYNTYAIKTLTGTYPGDTAAKALVVAYLNERLTLGHDLFAGLMTAAIMSVPGVLDVTSSTFDVTAVPVNTASLTVDETEIGRSTTTRVTITSTPTVP